jgi:small subunit ribosomal protein S19
MSRSQWKGPILDVKSLNEIKQTKTQNEQKMFKINRNADVLPIFIGLTFNVHNGKSYSEVVVNENMVGHKFGEFSFTRAKYIFKKKKIKK